MNSAPAELRKSYIETHISPPTSKFIRIMEWEGPKNGKQYVRRSTV